MKTYPDDDFATFEERDAAVDSVPTLPDWTVKQTLERFSLSIYIFHGNYADLLRPITEYKEPGTFLALQDVRNRTALDDLFKSITRLLHNYLASAMTLVDHARILIENFYADEKYADLVAKYEAEKSRCFIENPLHPFIQKLRNYSLHKSLPIVGSTLNLNDLTGHLIIRYSALRDDFDWGPRARVFLEGKAENGELEELITEYYNLVTGFYGWLHGRQMEAHADELAELNALNERVQKSRWTPKI